MTVQLQSRVSSILSVSSVSSVSAMLVTQKETPLHAGFKLGSLLPAPYHPGGKAGFVSSFVAYRATVTTVTVRASYCFSVSSQARLQTKDPVRALSERIRGH